MQVIVDESLGLPNEVLEEAVIRKAKLKNDSSLPEMVQKHKGGVIAKKLTVAKRNKESELEEMIQLLEQYEEILYVYDSFMLDEGLLKRIRTWAYPKRKLFLLNGAENRAFTIYFLEKLKEMLFEELYYSNHHPTKKFTITNDPKYQSGYLLLKRFKHKQFHVFDSRRQTKIVSGRKQDLLEQFIHLPSAEIYIASRKPIFPDHRSVKYFELQKHSLPVCSDWTDIFIPQY